MSLALVMVPAEAELRVPFVAPRLTRLKTFDASARAAHRRRSLEARLQTLEEETAAYLNHAHSGSPGNNAKGAGVERASGVAQIDEVEDVSCFAAELELRPAVNGEVTEQRRIHGLVSWTTQGVDSDQPIEAHWTSTSGATSRRYRAIH